MCPPLPSRVGHAAAYGIWQYLIVFLMAQSAWAQPADWIYHGGSVVTLDDDQRVTEALAMGGGRIARPSKIWSGGQPASRCNSLCATQLRASSSSAESVGSSTASLFIVFLIKPMIRSTFPEHQ